MITPHKNMHIHEVEKFENLAHQWWDESGPYQSLHALNFVRLGYIRNLLLSYFKLTPSKTPLKNLHILDIGCGGGLMAEPLCRLGASVTAIDPGKENIATAKAHAHHFGLNIFYSQSTLEDFNDHKTYDVLLALEVLEHIPNPQAFLKECLQKTKPQGLCIVATLNRTWRSYLQGIIAAERLLKWVPQGTHQWSSFLKPSELYHHFSNAGFSDVKFQGISFSILKNEWVLSDTLEVNYMAYGIQ
ncbi:MAG: bifunctional 2-polyprenyl-6-hydroxyphenol methylase/3-demethylubiquinol 3-O-methyltransferase UbiG [Alphaproteobacteria bacterium]